MEYSFESLESFSDSSQVKIPKDRVAVLIGTKGDIKKKIENY